MGDLRGYIKENFFDVKNYLEKNDIKGAYIYLNEKYNIEASTYIPEITLALYNAGIDPLFYTDTIPDNFLFGIYTQLEPAVSSNFKIPNNIKFIGDYAFAHASFSFKEIRIPESVFSIGDSAFLDTPFIEIYLPRSIEMLENDCFGYCENLKTIHYAGTKEEWADLLENSSGGDIYEQSSLKQIFGPNVTKKILSGNIKIIYEDGFSKT